MKNITRVDVFANMDEYIKFMDWARTKNPKTKADMVKLLGEYKRPEMVIDAHKERVEHEIVKKFKVGRVKPQKGE